MKIKGFTLLELLITMSLLLVVSTLSVVSYSYLLRKNEQQVLIDELKIALHYAKTQAFILGKTVFLNSIDDTPNWANGMFLSSLNYKTQRLERIHQWQWHHPRFSLTWDGVRIANQLSFSPNHARAISNGRFILMNHETRQQIIIILNRLGRVRIQ